MTTAKPFVKWAGGKNSHVEVIAAMLPAKCDTYYEPFVGGGAVFFHLASQSRFRHAVLSDSCRPLIEAYEAIKRTCGKKHGVDYWLRRYATTYSKSVDRSLEHAERFFLNCRNADKSNLSLAERGALFIFLNKTCFNGLYRVNRAGQFNVSFGKNVSPRIYDAENLERVSKALQHVDLYHLDFADALDLGEAGDAIYLDPPYYPRKKESFTGYSVSHFSPRDHVRLRRAWRAAAARGVHLVQTNSDVAQIRKLYEGYPVYSMKQRRSISAKPAGRRVLNDLLIATGEGHGSV